MCSPSPGASWRLRHRRPRRRQRCGIVGTAVDGGSVDEDWSFAKVIVKVDLTALDRGETLPSEVCEVTGQGPVPVPDVWRMIDGDAFIAAVATKGTEISEVVHLGRKPTVLQRTALDSLGDGACQIDGCNSRARLEIDHVTDWAATRRTELGELARVCGHHHDLKTHHRHTFGPLQPDGTRQLVPPDGSARPPDGVGPPDLTLHDGQPQPGPHPDVGSAPAGEPPPTRATPTPSSSEGRARAIGRRSPSRTRGQGDFFDTG